MLNVVVDPFDVFGWNLSCFAAHKNDIVFNRVTIVHRAERADPELLVLGTSRVMTFEAQELATLAGREAYVLPVPAGNIYEVRRHFEHYTARKSVRSVLLGLDYYAFNPARGPYAGFDEARLQGQAPPWKDHALVATHYKALFQSLKILGACLTGASAEEPVDEDLRIDLALRFGRRWDFYGSESLEDAEAMRAQIGELRKIVELAAERGIELHLFINPFHHEHWHMIHAVGRGDSFADWKRSLVGLGPLWDFSGSNSVSRDDANFIDTSHYRANVAGWIARRLLDLDQTGVPADFGVWLDAGSLEARLDDEQRQVDPAIVEELRALLGR